MVKARHIVVLLEVLKKTTSIRIISDFMELYHPLSRPKVEEGKYNTLSDELSVGMVG